MSSSGEGEQSFTHSKTAGRTPAPLKALFLLGSVFMQGLHSATKGEREVIRQLTHLVLVRDMGTFNPDRFREWTKAMDTNFRKVGLTLVFKIHDRMVHFTIKQLRGSAGGGGRVIFQFQSATRVRFNDSDVATVAPIMGNC